MTPVRTPSRSTPPSLRRRRLLYGAVAAVGVTVILRLAVSLSPSVDFVPRVEVRNRSAYSLELEVSGTEPGARLPLGTVPRQSAKSFQQVIDQGDTWVFRFSYAGRQLGGVTLTRAELAGAGWRLTVPRELTARLSEEGVPPSAL